MIGLDTGFFVELLKNNQKAKKLWEETMEGEESAVSCLTLFELQRLSLRGIIANEVVSILLEAILAICKVAWLNNVDVLREAAHISRTHGIHAIDSLILAGFAALNVKTIYTTDSHFENYKRKGIGITLLTRTT